MARAKRSTSIFAAGTALAALMVAGLSVGPVHAQATVRQKVITCAKPSTITTGPRETAEAILSDGSSVVIAPGGEATVGCDQKGGPHVTLNRGLIRVAGRNLSVTTPQAGLALVSGAAVVEATPDGTRTHLLNGEGLRVSARGSDRLIYRPGFQVVVTGERVTQPRRIAAQALIDDILRLSEGLRTGVRPRSSTQPAPSAGPVAPRPARAAVEANAESRLEPDARITPPAREPEPEPPVFQLAGGLGSGGLSPTTGSTQSEVSESSTYTVTTNHVEIRQQFDDRAPDGLNEYHYAFSEPVHAGPTTNRLFTSGELTQSRNDGSTIGAIDGGVGYYYGTDTWGIYSIHEFATWREWRLANQRGENRPYEEVSGNCANYDCGLVRFGKSSADHDAYNDLISINTTFGEVSENLRSGAIPEDGILNEGASVIMRGTGRNTRFDRAGKEEESGSDTLTGLKRQDNFIFLDMKILRSIDWSQPCSGSFCDPVDFDAVLQQKLAEYTANAHANGVEGEATVRQIIWKDAGHNGAVVLIDDPSETRRYVFATGGLDQVLENRNPGRRVDSFYLSPGMEGSIATTGVVTTLIPGMDLATGSRAFLRAESWTDLAPAALGFDLKVGDLAQTPFYVAYTGEDVISDTAPPHNPKAFHADLGFSTVGDRQVSTISATIGEVWFRYDDELDGGNPALGNEKMVDGILKLHTVGSSRGLTASGASRAAIGFSSKLRSTAAGGGNPNLDADADGVADPGRLGFFVLENAGKVFDDVEAVPDLPGGLESPVGGSDSRFALLRLGVATGSTMAAAPQGGLQGHLGYAAGILDVATGSGASRAPFGYPDLNPSTRLAPNLSFDTFDETARSFTVTLGGHTLGGANGESAFIDRKTFGARSPDAGGATGRMAMISGASTPLVKELVQGAAAPARGDLTATMSGYEHVQWGYFFGDMPAGGQRQHAAMGTWASGAPFTVANPGEVAVTYQGHAIGNVSRGDQVYTAVGGYEDRFDFRSRTGQVTISDFDGMTLSGDSSSRWNGSTHDYMGKVTGGGVTGELNGMFVGTGAMTPSGVVGAFSMTDSMENGFRAVGSFAGEQRP